MTLNDLKQNIASVIAKMKANLTGKGVAVDETDTLHTLVDKVNDISSGGGFDTSLIGYTTAQTLIYENIQKQWQDEAISIYNNWDANNPTSFDGNDKIEYLPNIDTSKKTSLQYFLRQCRALKFAQIDCSNANQITSTFLNCYNLKVVRLYNTKTIINISYAFENCSLLSDINFEDIDFSNVWSAISAFRGTAITSFHSIDTSRMELVTAFFENCFSLERIESFDMKSVNQNIGNFLGSSWSFLTKLKYALIKNMGYQSNTSYVLNFGGASAWGTGSAENRQSLIDSLITYSFDRVTAGYGTLTIQLHANVKALLTEDEITQITNKGYTIA